MKLFLLSFSKHLLTFTIWQEPLLNYETLGQWLNLLTSVYSSAKWRELLITPRVVVYFEQGNEFWKASPNIAHRRNSAGGNALSANPPVPFPEGSVVQWLPPRCSGPVLLSSLFQCNKLWGGHLPSCPAVVRSMCSGITLSRLYLVPTTAVPHFPSRTYLTELLGELGLWEEHSEQCLAHRECSIHSNL